MRATLLPCVFLAIPLAFPCQEDDPRVRWLSEQTVAVRTIEPTPGEAGDDFADLMPLLELIGDARVVGLGEQTHGDGATFHAKARLVRFLHEVMDFDVLVWESGLFDCAQVEEALRAGTPMREAWRKGIFGVWGASSEVQPVFDYVDATRAKGDPLEIAGLDAQFTSGETLAALRTFLEELDESAGHPEDLALAFEAIDYYLERTGAGGGARPTEEDWFACDESIHALREALEAPAGPFARIAPGERSFLDRALRNLNAMAEMIRAAPSNMQRYAAIRETAMADTLIWLAQEHYPDRRLIVWAASSHLTYGSRTVEMPTEEGGWALDDGAWEPMGNRVREVFGDDLYVIDFLAYDGETGTALGGARSPLEPAAAGTLDALCHATGRPYLFMDLRTLSASEGGAWLGERLVARPRGYVPMRAVWGQVCDAFFFTDRMFPSSPVR
jgi:erythromycin esterase